MGAVTISDDFRSISKQPPTDPDIHATLSDYLTYTEHFPSHLTRALKLIAEQRRVAEAKIASIHADTTSYALLPTLPKDTRPDPVLLRRNISYALEDAERACRMRVAEAQRLEEMALRESKRLDIVLTKLKAQPMPPSRDPTPEQQERTALTSPNLKREGVIGVGTRSADVLAEEVRPARRLDKAASKLRGRKVMVPGEVLPPPDPNALIETMSDWTSPRRSPIIEEPPPKQRSLKPASARPRSRTPRPPKPTQSTEDATAEKLQRTPKPRGPRQPGQPGTNAHSQLAGISTTNALLALKPPPDEAVNGSRWLPWNSLTEWEMARLRKRMKKNAIWIPSKTMVRRELKTLGRGVAGRDAAKVAAAEGGPDFVDENGEPDPTKVEVSGEDQATMNAMLGPAVYTEGDDDADAELINRGMRLNEAKKMKRARMLEEQQAAAAQLAAEGGDSVITDTKPPTAPETNKKRKRDITPAASSATALPLETPDPLSKPGPPLKKIRLAPFPTTSKVPLAPAGPVPRSSNRRAATPPAQPRRPTLILKASKAVSEEPASRRTSLRRNSITSLPSPNRAALAAAAKSHPSRRSRRPAPGVVAPTDTESAKVGYSRRLSAPRKGALKAATTAPVVPEIEEEFIDPDEPRSGIVRTDLPIERPVEDEG
ncbi:hypothetical protein B0A48_13492 [Cryoendolithus antarcticus]|uniref:Inhibitor of growth protein N-terminal histone-binding domain-containing protein n=1 Tax=Cryoendolithus antarcticus TaxID=1507870 RepID=A0A1V8SNS1_9PEZI|nr:hypothetical protein B0A48_13492 [Cryoendolithus antarcticus]